MVLSNGVLFFAILVAAFSFTLLMQKMFGKQGLFAATGILLVMGNMVVAVTFEVSGLVLNVLSVYGGVFLATDLLSENYGKEAAKTAVKFGFVLQISFMVIMGLVGMIQPMEGSIIAHESLRNIFSFMPRITIASLTAYYIASMIDVNIYNYIKEKLPSKKHLWIRNNVSTFTGKFVDSIVFFGLMGILGVLPMSIAVHLILTGFVGKWIVAALDTPFVYLGSHEIMIQKVESIAIEVK